jgi:translation initiation factor 1
VDGCGAADARLVARIGFRDLLARHHFLANSRGPTMAVSKRIPTDGGPAFGQNPFAALSSDALPAGPENSTPISDSAEAPTPAKKSRGRVDVLRVKAGRGGKTVTIVKNFAGIGLPEKERLARAMQKACGAGGTVKDGQIEIQGDNREEVARILVAANFRPVFAGG